MKTVKVKIAVAVDETGKWIAGGGTGYRNWDECMEVLLDDLQDGESRYWIEAELPIPETQTIQGEVTTADSC